MKRRTAGISAIGALLLSGAVLGQDIPIRSWEVPRDGFSKLALGPSANFAPVNPPCRLDDSRLSSGGVGPIPASGTRVYDFLPSGGVGCGSLPDNAVALSVFITVVNPSGPGFLYAFPTGTPPGSPTSILNYNAGELKNAAAVIPVNGSGAFTVGVGGAGTDLIIDLNGIYFNGQGLYLTALVENSTVLGVTNTGSFGTAAITGLVNGFNAAGVFAQVGAGGDAPSAGVKGFNLGAGAGVRGTAETGPGVEGTSQFGSGVSGVTDSGFAGVAGSSVTGVGVFGSTPNTGNGAAGVEGIAGALFTVNTLPHAGVKGMSHSGRGVLGIVDNFSGRGVSGHLVTNTGAEITSGHLAAGATTGVFSNGDIMATGTKFFVEPHPSDPSRVIRFISLEGNEPGTYFRGRGRFERGLARIAVPEEFRIVTDGEGLSVQVTPIGEMATVAVVQLGLDEILVRSSRNVEFFYLVQGVRKAYKDVRILAEDDQIFVPRGPDAAMPLWLSEDAKRRLISNGTYNADGTVNLETAKRLGWDKAWAKEKR